jgi:hypothetical protein
LACHFLDAPPGFGLVQVLTHHKPEERRQVEAQQAGFTGGAFDPFRVGFEIDPGTFGWRQGPTAASRCHGMLPGPSNASAWACVRTPAPSRAFT